MSAIVLCSANFSEGRDPNVIAFLEMAISEEPNVRLLRTECDPDHNRSVITFAGTPNAVVNAAFLACEAAVRQIDLRKHTGVHPRIGAADVIPFVPVTDVTMSDCIVLANTLGKLISERLSVPVFLYAEAARKPGYRELAFLRRGGFEALRAAKPGVLIPDFGHSGVHRSAGATAVGARSILIAFNVPLNTSDLTVGKRIARLIRERDGGFGGVKALAFYLESRQCVQISMNLTDPDKTGIPEVYNAIRSLAAEDGVSIGQGELIGLAPLDAILKALTHGVPFQDMGTGRILEYCLWNAFHRSGAGNTGHRND